MAQLKAHKGHGWMTKRLVEGFKADSTGLVPKQRDYFRGSETDACARKIWFARRGVTPSVPFSPVAQEKMRKGDRYQDYIRELIHKYSDYRVTQIEVPLTGTFTAKNGTVVSLSGRIDGVLEDDSGDLALLEVKTTSHWGMTGLMKSKFLDQEHYTWGYVLQCHRYIAMWNAAFPDGKISKFCLFVYDVNGDEVEDLEFPAKDFWFKYNPKIWEEEVERLARIEEALREDTMPERCYPKIDWECAGCPYLFQCWPDESEREYASSKFAKKVAELEAVTGGGTARRTPPRAKRSKVSN
jgi:hypothetical protein